MERGFYRHIQKNQEATNTGEEQPTSKSNPPEELQESKMEQSLLTKPEIYSMTDQDANRYLYQQAAQIVRPILAETDLERRDLFEVRHELVSKYGHRFGTNAVIRVFDDYIERNLD